MHSTLAHLTVLTSTLIVSFGAIGASPAIAQTRVTSLEELRRHLAAGDLITVVPAAGPPLAGRLTRLGSVDIDLRLVAKGTPPQARGPRDVTIPFDAILSLERPRDSVRNGAVIGGGIGAAFGGAMFVLAAVTDRNEMDEWAGPYAGATAICAGIGALIGWATDAANSKPHIRFDTPSGGSTTVSVQPVYSRGRGIALAVSLSR